MNIKRYTEQATDIIALRHSDIGRPISELASRLVYDGLVKDCSKVLDTLAFKKMEVQTIDGGWYLMRIMPYRTVNKVVDGLVLTFLNIKELKEAERTGAMRTYFESIFDTVRQPLVVLDAKFNVVSANRRFLETFQMRPKQVLGNLLFSIGDGDWDTPELRELLEEILQQNASFENYKVEQNVPKFGRRVFMLSARRLAENAAFPDRILLAMEDVTESDAS